MESSLVLELKEKAKEDYINKDYDSAKHKWLLALKSCQTNDMKKILLSNLAILNNHLKNYDASLMSNV